MFSVVHIDIIKCANNLDLRSGDCHTLLVDLFSKYYKRKKFQKSRSKRDKISSIETSTAIFFSSLEIFTDHIFLSMVSVGDL